MTVEEYKTSIENEGKVKSLLHSEIPRIAWYLWNSREPELIKKLEAYLVERYMKISCAVIFKHSPQWQEAGFPEIGNKEVIIYQNGSVNYCHI